MRGMSFRIGAVLLAAIVASGVWSGAAWSADGNSGGGAGGGGGGSADQHRHGDHEHPHSGASGETGGAEGGMPRTVVGAHDLMELFNEPLYEDLKEAMQREANDEERWEMIEHLGVKTAEIANLVAIRNGEHASEEPAEWREYSTGMHQAGQELAEAAGTQDFQAVQRAYRGVVNACNACHDHFAPDDAPNLEP